MAKKKQEKPRYEPTRRQRSRWKQQKRRQRIIFSVAIVIVVAVLSVIGVGVYKGWYVSDYKPLHEVVLEVNGTKFNMEYYINMLKYHTQDMSPEWAYYMSDSVIEVIERDELARQEAEALGITVSDEELDEVISVITPPPPEEYRDAIAGEFLLLKMRDEYFEEQVSKYADQRHIMAMFLESEAQANEVIDRMEAGEDFSALAAALSLDEVTKEAEGDLGWRPAGVLPFVVESTVLEESAFSAEVGVLSQPIWEETKTKQVGYWLIEVIEVDETVDPIKATVRRILVGSEQEALDLRDRLEAGEDFAELAAEFSLDTLSNTTGGEITISPLDSTAAFDVYVFDPDVELGVLSQPIRDTDGGSTGGYWLIEVVASEENREIDDESRLILKKETLSNWLEELTNNPENNVVNHLDEEKIQWAVSYITGGVE